MNVLHPVWLHYPDYRRPTAHYTKDFVVIIWSLLDVAHDTKALLLMNMHSAVAIW